MSGINTGALVAIAVAFYIIFKKKNKWQRNDSPASVGEHCLYSEERSEKPEDRL